MTLGNVRMEREAMLAFARRWDPQGFHVDETAAAASSFGGLIASGLHTLSAFMRLYTDHWLLGVANLGGQGIDDIRFTVPVRPGDTLTALFTVAEVRPSERRPDRGTVTTEGAMRNERGETVMTLTMRTRVARREAAFPGI